MLRLSSSALRTTLVSMIVAWIVVGCKDGADFAGSSASQTKKDESDAEKADPNLGTTGEDDEADDEQLGETYEVPDNCTADGVTHAKLLSKSVKNDTPGQFIEYQLFVTDCEGKVRDVSSDLILFDLNSVTDGGMNALRFQVQTTKRVQIASGGMEVVKGKDLFGNASPTYFHYRTDKRIEFSVPSKSFIFRIEPGHGRETAAANMGTAAALGDQEIETYLRFGSASTVKQVVTFINK